MRPQPWKEAEPPPHRRSLQQPLVKVPHGRDTRRTADRGPHPCGKVLLQVFRPSDATRTQWHLRPPAMPSAALGGAVHTAASAAAPVPSSLGRVSSRSGPSMCVSGRCLSMCKRADDPDRRRRPRLHSGTRHSPADGAFGLICSIDRHACESAARGGGPSGLCSSPAWLCAPCAECRV